MPGFDPTTAMPPPSPKSEGMPFDPTTATPATPAQKMAKATAPSGASQAFNNGLTFGFGDEMTAALSAGLTGVANVGTRMMGGKPQYSAGEAYDAMLDQQRLNSSQYHSEHPISAISNDILGGIMNPVSKLGAGWVGEGATKAARIGRGAVVGAGAGTVAGFGSGQDGLLNRAKDAAWGATGGLVTGGTLSSVAEAVPTAARGIQWAAKGMRSAFQQMTGKTPEEAAAILTPDELNNFKDMASDYVKDLIKRSGKTIESLTADPAHVQGKPVTGAEAISPQAETELATIARRPGETGSIADSDFRVRGNERNDRVLQGLSKAAGLEPQSVQGDMEHLNDSLRARNSALYEKAEAGPPPVNNPELDKLMKIPDMQKAMGTARDIAQKRGENPDDIAVVSRPKQVQVGTDANGKPIMHEFPGREEEYEMANPSMKSWDYVKRALGTNIGRKNKNSFGQMVTDDQTRADFSMADRLRDALFAHSPDYQNAVAHGGEPIKLEQAYGNASKLMGSTTSEHEFHANMDKMTPAEIAATKAGWVNDVYKKLQNNGFKPQDLATPNFMNKARRLLGETQARQFVGELQQEIRLKSGEGSIPPKTQSVSMKLLDSAQGMDQKTDDMIHGLADAWSRRGMPYALRKFAIDRVYDVFEAARVPEREVLRNEVGKMLLMKPDQLRAVLESPPVGKGSPSPKARELGRMIQHTLYGTAAVVPQTQTIEANQ